MTVNQMFFLFYFIAIMLCLISIGGYLLIIYHDGKKDSSTEEGVEYSGKVSEDVLEITKYRGEIMGSAAHALQTGKSELVVSLTFLIVCQNLVGFCGLLELLLGVFVTGVSIWVKFYRESAVGFLDVFALSIPGNSQHLIIISLSQVYATLRSGNYEDLDSSSSTTS